MFDDAIQRRGFKVGQCDIVAVQEGESIVFIFDVQRSAETFGELVDKTEETVVGATGRSGGGKRQPERLSGLTFDLHLPQLAIRFFNLQQQLYLGSGVIAVIDQIPQRLAVNSQQTVARRHLKLVGYRSGGDIINPKSGHHPSR